MNRNGLGVLGIIVVTAIILVIGVGVGVGVRYAVDKDKGAATATTITRESAKQTIREYLISNGIIELTTNLRMHLRWTGRYVGPWPPISDEEAKRIGEGNEIIPPRPWIERNTFAGIAYFESLQQHSSGTTYEYYGIEINSDTNEIVNVQKKTECTFNNIRSEDMAIEAVARKTGKTFEHGASLFYVSLFDCIWTVNADGGEYFVYDNGDIEFIPPVTLID